MADTEHTVIAASQGVPSHVVETISAGLTSRAFVVLEAAPTALLHDKTPITNQPDSPGINFSFPRSIYGPADIGDEVGFYRNGWSQGRIKENRRGAVRRLYDSPNRANLVPMRISSFTVRDLVLGENLVGLRYEPRRNLIRCIDGRNRHNELALRLSAKFEQTDVERFLELLIADQGTFHTPENEAFFQSLGHVTFFSRVINNWEELEVVGLPLSPLEQLHAFCHAHQVKGFGIDEDQNILTLMFLDGHEHKQLGCTITQTTTDLKTIGDILMNPQFPKRARGKIGNMQVRVNGELLSPGLPIVQANRLNFLCNERIAVNHHLEQIAELRNRRLRAYYYRDILHIFGEDTETAAYFGITDADDENAFQLFMQNTPMTVARYGELLMVFKIERELNPTFNPDVSVFREQTRSGLQLRDEQENAREFGHRDIKRGKNSIRSRLTTWEPSRYLFVFPNNHVVALDTPMQIACMYRALVINGWCSEDFLPNLWIAQYEDMAKRALQTGPFNQASYEDALDEAFTYLGELERELQLIQSTETLETEVERKTVAEVAEMRGKIAAEAVGALGGTDESSSPVASVSSDLDKAFGNLSRPARPRVAPAPGFMIRHNEAGPSTPAVPSPALMGQPGPADLASVLITGDGPGSSADRLAAAVAANAVAANAVAANHLPGYVPSPPGSGNVVPAVVNDIALTNGEAGGPPSHLSRSADGEDPDGSDGCQCVVL